MTYERAGLKEAPLQPDGGDDRIRGKPSHGRRSGSRRFGTTGRFVLAVAASGLITLFVIGLLPDLLPASTDIVGYPIWAPFDTRRYTAIYVLSMVLFPVLTAIGFVLLGGSGRDTSQPRFEWPRSSRAASVHGDQRRPSRVVVASALVLVALPAALALGVAADVDGGSLAILLLVTLTVAVLVLGLGLLAVVAERQGVLPFDDAAWALIALMAPASVLWLSVLSAWSGVRVTATGTFHSLHWFPFWLGVPATLLAVGVVAWLLRHRSRHEWVTIARWSLTCITIPVLLWELVGALSPAIGSIDPFHEGEGLVGARLLLDGQVPWRDFLSTHGLLADTLVSLPGLALIEDSRWGAMSGELIWATPAYWIFSFGFMAYLLRRNTWLLALWFAVTALGASLMTAPWVGSVFALTSGTYARMLLYPLVLLAVAWVVRNPISRRIALLSGLLVLQVALTPEAAYLVPGVFIALVLYDLTHSVGASTLRRFKTSGLTALWCVAASAVLAGVLVISGSLGAFVNYFEVFASGHELTGGLPYVWGGSLAALVALVGVPLLFLGCSWYGLARLINRRPLELDDFVIIPAFVFGALYHTKFLSRPDSQHAIQSVIVVLPVIWYVIARLLDVVDGVWERRASRGPSTRGASIALATVALVLMVPAVVDTTGDLPTRYRPTVASEPLNERLGYTSKAIRKASDVPVDRFVRTTDDVGKVVDALAPETRHVFDFTNSPVMFGFALRYEQATRYYHVSMAIPLEAQRDLISDLEESDPAVVVGYSNGIGLHTWDQIPNMVRHYEVNRYLQTHYRPVVSVDGFLFLLRDDLPFDAATIRELDLNGRAAFGNLDDVSTPCDWRAVPERFAPHPAPDAETTGELDLVELEGTLEITGWVADQPQGEAVPEVVALAADGTVLAASAPIDGGPRGSRYRLQVPVEPAETVVVAARLADGTLLEITGRGVTRLADGETVPLGEAEGEVESVTLVPIRDGERAHRFLVPGGPRDWNWLTLHGADDLAAGEYTIGTPAGDGDIRVLLTQGGQESTSVMVGACNHWYDYQSPVRVISTPEMASKPRVELTG